ncbi:hypothetical protein PUNSTDRAFT_137420 [Punctularia strigosozonata HHB-11173 SS5]|uniref:uncharacterized protein n=1 Tax=Punctularia strigosozonata (strain HHB-11173) TaxID=741275 RepID=UPI000441840A|nr:uncharacterized protein PUNSTDRAFT_137420 [Punctularia strigosozonata HHB-11173 SS5]EIN05935.1 hypothetical protein PUNSTDRAFT_137420 [Punctularia strigosozonata HHB-11173 SS5]
MVSSLAAQLAQGASLNSSLLVDRSRRGPTQSYLFTGRSADEHDLDSIYALGCNGLLQLGRLNSAFTAFADTLFSDQAKTTDRTLQTKAQNEELDNLIAEFLQCLGPWLLEAPAGKVLEWLVRRFRIHEFNVESVIALFLPYHESPHFAKMVTILHIRDHPTWRFLQPFAKAGKSLPRTALVTEMLKSPELTRSAVSLLPAALRAQHVHRTLVAFTAGTLLEYISRSEGLSEGVLAMLIPAFLAPLEKDVLSRGEEGGRPAMLIREAILGSYVLLAALSQRSTLTPAALKTALERMAAAATSGHVEASQFINAAVAVCAPQEELETLKLPLSAEISDAAIKALAYHGSDKLLGPVLNRALSPSKETLSVEIAYLVEKLFTASNPPSSLIRRITALLLARAIRSKNRHDAERALLATVQQRHLEVFKSACDEYLTRTEEEDDEDHTALRNEVDQLLISLSLPPAASGSKHALADPDMILASAHADASVRLAAVRKLIGTLIENSSSTDEAELQSIRSALLQRVHDTDPSVVGELYAHPELILPSIAEEENDEFLATLAAHLESSGSRQLIRLHLTFVAAHSSASSSAGSTFDSNAAVLRLFFPFLIFSKPRQKSAAAAWDVVQAHEGIADSALLKGCVDVLKKSGEITGEIAMREANASIAEKLAENLIALNSYEQVIGEVIARLHESSTSPNGPHARILAYLVLRSLLSRLSSEQQVEMAHRALDAIDLQSLDAFAESLARTQSSEDPLGDDALNHAIVTKPTSPNTLRRLQASLFAFLPQIHKPESNALPWLAQSGDDHGLRYVQLMRRLYALANATGTVPLLSATINRNLFVALATDSLAFLAGIWIRRDGTDSIRKIALAHAVAFLAAHTDMPKPVDFQTVLPCLLVGLQSGDRPMREGAMSCVVVLAQLATAQQASAVYALDTIYGSHSAGLQYVEWEDSRRYLAALVERQDHLVSDSSQLRVFHRELLSRSKSDSKKDGGYKQRMLCYLLSHVSNAPAMDVRLPILRSLQDVKHVVKFQMLMPVVQRQIDFVEAHSEVANGEGDAGFDEFMTLCAASVGGPAARDCNEPSSQQWPLFGKALQWSFGPGINICPNMRKAMTDNLRDHLFAALNNERKMELCSVLLEIGSQGGDVRNECLGALSHLLNDVPVIVKLLTTVQPASDAHANRSAKRAKLDGVVEEDSLQSLALLAEALNNKTLPASFDLVSALLDTLSSVVHSDATLQLQRGYVAQLLMSALDNVTSRLVELPNIEPSPIRASILVDVIRITDNPQTFHQALLLMATLARLAPDAVVQNIMPIFIFMGSNVFHRDDPYSFRVVQKTIDSIVPVMMATLRTSHEQKRDLWIAARSFLQLFTDAVNHVPRHRRLGFYSHLVDVLGAEEFLSPVTMLLVDKVASRVARQSREEARQSLIIPLALLHRSSRALQITSFLDFLDEAYDSLLTAFDMTPERNVFLSASPDPDEDHPSRSKQLLRRAHALLVLVAESFKLAKEPFVGPASEDAGVTIGSVVPKLLRTYSLSPSGREMDTAIVGLHRTARVCLEEALQKMAVPDFARATLHMLRSGDDQIKVAALTLLIDRLHLVTEDARQLIAPVIAQIVDVIVEITSTSKSENLIQAAFKSLKEISNTMCAGEEASLMQGIPPVLAAMRTRSDAAAAVSVLPSLCVALGPRVIPHFRAVVQECIALVRESFRDMESSSAVHDCLDVLKKLLSSIPSFWGSADIAMLVSLYMDYSVAPGSQSSPVEGVIRALAKRAPSDLLLTTLCEMWPSGGLKDVRKYLAYFECMKRALRIAQRTVVSEHIRQLFKVFMAAFDLRHDVESESIEEAEHRAIEAFVELTSKLNDISFKPLFRRLYDWSFTNSNLSARQVTFCRTFMALLEYFKALMTPYMSFLLQPFIEKLLAYSSGSERDRTLWTSVIQVLVRSLAFDDGGKWNRMTPFWRDDKLRALVSPLVNQLAVCINLNIAEGRDLLSTCLTAVVDATTDDDLLKSINLKVLMHTRSEEVKLRILALNCSTTLWAEHGGKLLGLATETATFIAECAEDESDNVVKAAIELKDAVESVAGSIQV